MHAESYCCAGLYGKDEFGDMDSYVQLANAISDYEHSDLHYVNASAILANKTDLATFARRVVEPAHIFSNTLKPVIHLQ